MRPSRSRGRPLALAALVALALSAAAITAATPQTKTVIRYGIPSYTAVTWPSYVADAQGFYDREGLTVETNVIDHAVIVSALIGGSLDVGLADPSGIVASDDKGADVVGVGSGADRNPYKLMAAPGITSIKGLKGKKIAAASPVEMYTTVIKMILRKGGLDPDRDVDFMFGAGQNQRFAALLGGAVDAGLFSPPADEKLAARGFHALAFTPDYVPYLQLSITAVRRSWAQQHADVLRRFLRAQAEASRWLNDPANRTQAIAILAKATNSTTEEAAVAYESSVAKTHLYPDDFCVLRPGMRTLLKMLHDQGKTRSDAADVGKYVD